MTAPTTTEPIVGPEILDVKTAAETDARYHSVTTIIDKIGDKQGLIGWAAKRAAECAIRDIATWKSMEESSGTDEARKWISAARFRSPRDELTEKAFGTEVHALCEEFALTGTKPTPNPERFKGDLERGQACLDRFDEWLHEFQPEYQAAELTVYNRTYGYAGTCDAFLTIGGVRFIADYKTTKIGFDDAGKAKPIYPETALQLSAYRHAELAAIWRPRRYEQFRRRYYLLSQMEVDQGTAVPEVDSGLGIKLSPEYCHAHKVTCGPDVFEAFLFAMEIARWDFDLSKHVIGAPLVPPGGAS